MSETWLTTCSLVVNIIAGHVTEPARRTAVFGKLQGALMLAQGIGYLGESLDNKVSTIL